jgi:hypothetical protein
MPWEASRNFPRCSARRWHDGVIQKARRPRRQWLGGSKMKRLVFAVLLSLAIVVPIPAMAAVDIHIGFSLPPPILFPAPPEVIVLPDTNDVYCVPDIDVDIFFWNGWWWRPWEGRWYRSRYYDRGWAYYDTVPRFYFDIDPGWRGYYRDHDWHGHRWNYERIPDRRLQQNWRTWQNNRHWERQRTWGVQNYRPRPPQQKQELRIQRQQEYRQRPEVQLHQQQRQQQQRQSQVQKPQGQQRRQPQIHQPPQQHQPQVSQPQGQPQPQHRPQIQQPERKRQPEQQQSQPRGRQPQAESQHQPFQGKPEGGRPDREGRGQGEERR